MITVGLFLGVQVYRHMIPSTISYVLVYNSFGQCKGRLYIDTNTEMVLAFPGQRGTWQRLKASDEARQQRRGSTTTGDKLVAFFNLYSLNSRSVHDL